MVRCGLWRRASGAGNARASVNRASGARQERCDGRDRGIRRLLPTLFVNSLGIHSSASSAGSCRSLACGSWLSKRNRKEFQPKCSGEHRRRPWAIVKRRGGQERGQEKINGRSQRISGRSERPREVGASPAEDKNRAHGQHRKDRKANARIDDDALLRARPEQDEGTLIWTRSPRPGSPPARLDGRPPRETGRPVAMA